MTRTRKFALLAGVAAILGGVAIAGAVEARDGHRDFRGHRGGFERGHQMMEQFDANSDGNVTPAEVEQARKDRLAKFDADKNGTLDLNEFEALWLDHTRQQMVRAFQRLDSDGNAAVTAEEYVTPYQRMVRRMDRNSDGQISKDDVQRRFHRDGERHRGADRSDQSK